MIGGELDWEAIVASLTHMWLPGAQVPGWLGGFGSCNGGQRSYLD